MKPSKFETYLLDEEYECFSNEIAYKEVEQPYENEQYPEGFYTEL